VIPSMPNETKIQLKIAATMASRTHHNKLLTITSR